VLVEIVRFTQKNGLKGAEGGWKDFLDRNDKKYGVSVSDPKKRTKDVLLAFLVTFSKDFQKVLIIWFRASQPCFTACAVRFLQHPDHGTDDFDALLVWF
jgi:hypothetical protein